MEKSAIVDENRAMTNRFIGSDRDVEHAFEKKQTGRGGSPRHGRRTYVLLRFQAMGVGEDI